MQSTGYIDWKGTGWKCWNRKIGPNERVVEPIATV
jgi:hypothetical protein